MMSQLDRRKERCLSHNPSSPSGFGAFEDLFLEFFKHNHCSLFFSTGWITRQSSMAIVEQERQERKREESRVLRIKKQKHWVLNHIVTSMISRSFYYWQARPITPFKSPSLPLSLSPSFLFVAFLIFHAVFLLFVLPLKFFKVPPEWLLNPFLFGSLNMSIKHPSSVNASSHNLYQPSIWNIHPDSYLSFCVCCILFVQTSINNEHFGGGGGNSGSDGERKQESRCLKSLQVRGKIKVLKDAFNCVDGWIRSSFHLCLFASSFAK